MKELNNDVQKLHEWTKTWLVKFSPRSESFFISLKVNQHNHTPLKLNNSLIEEVSSHKNLGVYFFQMMVAGVTMSIQLYNSDGLAKNKFSLQKKK